MRLENACRSGLAHRQFTTYSSVRERVNGVLALEIMGFAILLAGRSTFLSRKGAGALGLLPAGIGGASPVERIGLQREIAERSGSKRTWRWPSRRWRKARNWPPWARCRRRQPRVEPAAGGDEDLSCRRPAAVAAAPPDEALSSRSSGSTI
jgi:hypothetical protein